MPDDVAVAETPVETATTADPAEGAVGTTEAPPTPAEEAPPSEGDAAPGAEGGAPDYSEIEAELEAEAERRAEAKLAEREASLTERVKQRTKEADDGKTSRHALYDAAENEGQAAYRDLMASHENGDPLTRDEANKRVQKIGAYAIAQVSRENEIAQQAHIEASLPDLTDAEAEALEPLLYEFRRNGRFETLPAKVTELAIARKDAEIADLKKQLNNRTGLVSAAERLAKAREAAGNGVGSETPQGKQQTETSDEARKQRLAYGGATNDDRAWLQKQYPG